MFWPTGEGIPVTYGKLIVTLQSEEQGGELVTRKFEIKDDKVNVIRVLPVAHLISPMGVDGIIFQILVMSHLQLWVRVKYFLLISLCLQSQSSSSLGGPSKAQSFVVTLFHYPQWPEKGRPSDVTLLLQVIESLNVVQRNTGNKPITVMCKYVALPLY